MKPPDQINITEITTYARAELTPEIIAELYAGAHCVVTINGHTVIKDGVEVLQRPPCERSEDANTVQVERQWLWSKTGWPKDIYEHRTP